MFDLRQPCTSCPFRKGKGELFQLHLERLEEIRTASAFQCHKTVDYSGDTPDNGHKPQQCAGLMAVLHKENLPNQMMQVAERLGVLDPTQLDPRNETFQSWADVLIAHGTR